MHALLLHDSSTFRAPRCTKTHPCHDTTAGHVDRLDHAEHIFECLRKKTQPEPLRLLLLGTAGSGKTRAVQTALQEIQRKLAAAGLPFDVDTRHFVRVAAPTGSAAFNLRFHATTVHGLIRWFTPP